MDAGATQKLELNLGDPIVSVRRQPPRPATAVPPPEAAYLAHPAQVALHEETDLVALCSTNGKVEIYATASGDSVVSFKVPGANAVRLVQPFNKLAVSSFEHTICATGTFSGTITFHNVSTRSQVKGACRVHRPHPPRDPPRDPPRTTPRNPPRIPPRRSRRSH